MDGFADLVTRLISDASGHRLQIFRDEAVQLPGFFRATKEWDILVMRDATLVAAIELKSHVGSFGNNFNNRAEEAIGSATDIWTAFKKGAFGSGPEPWLGYLILLEDSPGARSPVKVQEPHFAVFPEFRGSSYSVRYELLCRKLVLERLYRAAAFLMSDPTGGRTGHFSEPAADLIFASFSKSLTAHCSYYANG